MDTDTYHNKEQLAEQVGAAATTAVLQPTERTTLKRHPERGSASLAEVRAILDEGFVCHVGLVGEHGPVVIPTSYGRVGDRLYLHGSPASRLFRGLKRGVPVCVTVTLVDALVLARSTYHHSMNYRSVVVFGEAVEVTDPSEKADALAAIVEHIVPGRTADARPATELEVKGTIVLALPIVEASAKVRTGPPLDEANDLELPVWAGVLPLTTVVGAPRPDAFVPADLDPPAYVTGYRRG